MRLILGMTKASRLFRARNKAFCPVLFVSTATLFALDSHAQVRKPARSPRKCFRP
jgi:hypothetical protein